MTYIYCLSNDSMIGIYKIMASSSESTELLIEANEQSEWIPTPYKIEFFKKVESSDVKIDAIHTLLEEFKISRNFFSMDIEDIRKIFESIPTAKEIINNVPKIQSINITPKKRDMKKSFSDSCRIRHMIGEKILIGIYDRTKNKIVCGDDSFNSLSGFALWHHKKYTPKRKSTNGWTECECEINGEWVKTNIL